MGLSLADAPPENVAKTAAQTPSTGTAPASSDAAEKHLKRTACLKEAKEKKLLGADKSAFLKNCIAAS